VNPRRANLLTVLGLLGLLVGVSATAPRWARLLTRPLPAGTEEAEPAPTRSPDAISTPAAKEPEAVKHINVKLFFQSPERPGLVIEERAVAFSGDLAEQLRSVLEELIKGSGAGLLPTVDPATRVLEVFVSARGIAYVDLSKEVGTGLPGGSEGELITVYSIVNSLTASFPAVKRVQILVDDHPASNLAGHVDLSRPLPADMTFLAAALLAPSDTTPSVP